MKVYLERKTYPMKGFCDVRDLTPDARALLRKAGIREGLCTVFVAGSTAAITTMEAEEGLMEDIARILERIAPQNEAYAHNRRWGDGNGFSHIRASLLGPSVTIPVSGGELLLGTWQQVVLLDFDNRRRQREVIFQYQGV